MLDIIIFLLQIVLGITLIYRGVTNRIEPMDVKIFKNPKHMYVAVGIFVLVLTFWHFI